MRIYQYVRTLLSWDWVLSKHEAVVAHEITRTAVPAIRCPYTCLFIVAYARSRHLSTSFFRGCFASHPLVLRRSLILHHVANRPQQRATMQSSRQYVLQNEREKISHVHMAYSFARWLRRVWLTEPCIAQMIRHSSKCDRVNLRDVHSLVVHILYCSGRLSVKVVLRFGHKTRGHIFCHNDWPTNLLWSLGYQVEQLTGWFWSIIVVHGGHGGVA